jgi:predicted DNA-binding transcriptional regulator YafY
MGKAERLQNLMFYAYRKRRFNVSDVISRFGVSKSTALRDIVSLQAMGVPLYTDLGKYGGYRILDTYALPPIVFTSAEVQALFFAMQSLESFESTPFDVEYENMKTKLYECLSDTNKASITAIDERVHLHQARQNNASTELKALLEAATSQSVVRITYLKHARKTHRDIQPIGLIAREGNWYCSAYDLKTRGYRVFRCDRVLAIVASDKAPVDLSKYTVDNEHALRRKTDQTLDFSVRLTDEGVDIFNKNSYPTFSLQKDQDATRLTGWYDPNEEGFVVNYLLSFGTTALIEKPDSLKSAMAQRLRRILGTYDSR